MARIDDIKDRARYSYSTDIEDRDWMIAEIERLTEGHCQDCCCARSWEALGITGYTGESIPEHITGMKDEIERLQETLKKVNDHLNPCGHTGLESLSCNVCGYPDPVKYITTLQARIKELEDNLNLATSNRWAEWEVNRANLAGDNMAMAFKISTLHAEANKTMTELCEARGRIKELEGAIRMLTTFFPEGWVMPLGWEQIVAQANQAINRRG